MEGIIQRNKSLKNGHKQPLHVAVSVFVHATERPEKVLEALKNTFPQEYEDLQYERSNLLGYYKNPIIVFKVAIKDSERAESFLKNILNRLKAEDKVLLLSNIGNYVDARGILYLRLDKQEALSGNIRLCSSDPIYVKIKFRNRLEALSFAL